jgi:ribonuclease HII
MSEKQKASEIAKTEVLYSFDRTIEKQCDGLIIGVDEVGRGPLAGPVVAAAVCLDLTKPIPGIDDSKKLSALKREGLYHLITTEAIAWAVGMATHVEIDKYNILQATFIAMSRAIEKLGGGWNIALVDGNKTIPSMDEKKQMAIIGGDAKSASIGAASIIAKVTRDRLMDEYHEKFPVYDFLENKGYPTEHHRNTVMEKGICEIHRRTFCETLLVSQTSLLF